MKNFILTIDSSCDGNLKELQAQDVDTIFYHYSDGKTDYLDDLDETKNKTFYDRMREGTKYSTSQLNQFAYYQFFKRNIEKNRNIIHISLTEGLSGSINQARIAAQQIMEEYPDSRISIIDSLIASNGELVLLDKAIELRNNNVPFIEAVQTLETYAKEINTFYTTDTLTYFVRGGRLSKAAGFLGNMLKINPVLICSPNGSLKIDKQVRGKKAAAKYIIEQTSLKVTNPSDQPLYICHADNLEGALQYKEEFQSLGFKEIKIYKMGTIIGTHTGPGLIAFFFHGKKRGSK